MRSGEAWRIAHTLALIAQGFLFALREADDRAALQDELEHAVLDDNSLAARLAVVRFGAAQRAMNDPHKRMLLARKEQLESAIDKLKFEKAAMPISEYKAKLSALLIDLAKTQEEIEK